MNEEFQKQLLEWARQAVQFGSENAPKVVAQYLTWWTWMHAMGIVLGVLLLAFCYFVSYRIFWKKYINEDSDEGWMIAATASGFASGISGTVAITVNIYNLVKILVAPAVYIIDAIVK